MQTITSAIEYIEGSVDDMKDNAQDVVDNAREGSNRQDVYQTIVDELSNFTVPTIISRYANTPIEYTELMDTSIRKTRNHLLEILRALTAYVDKDKTENEADIKDEEMDDIEVFLQELEDAIATLESVEP